MSGPTDFAFLPQPSWLTQPFWDQAAGGVLSRQQCRSCGYNMFPPQFACTTCLGIDLDWVASTGRGRVYSFSVLYIGVDGRRLAEPTILADVDLEEGWHMLTHIVNCPTEEVRCGLRVNVIWRPLSPTLKLPVFAPDTF